MAPFFLAAAVIVTPAFTHRLPPLHGDRLTAQVVEVTYAPGASSRPHRHACPVIVHVLSGALRSRVQGQPERVYPAGATFYEAPDVVHAVSANASTTAPAHFTATFVCDRP